MQAPADTSIDSSKCTAFTVSHVKTARRLPIYEHTAHTG